MKRALHRNIVTSNEIVRTNIILKYYVKDVKGLFHNGTDEGLHCAIPVYTTRTCSESLSHHLLFGKSLQQTVL